MAIWSLKGKNVLIVDDFQEMRVMIRSMIEPLAPDMIKMAQNGDEAIELLESHPFDVVFCDYNLGKGKDGQQILEEAKHRGLLPYSAVYIMTTAENTSEMVMGAIDYLPEDYISKPFNRTVIHTRLKRQLDKKENLSEVSKAIANKDFRKAIRCCDEILEKKPGNRLELIKIKGELFTRLGEFEAAADLYEDIIEERDIPWAYLSLGQVRFLQEDFHEALEVFEGLTKENASNVAAYDWLAKTYEAMGEADRAQEMLVAAVTKSPKSLIRQRKLAQIANKNSDFETARSAYESALQVGQYSCHKQASDYSAYAKSLVAAGKADDALRVVERISKDFQNDTGAELVAAITAGMIHKTKGNQPGSEKSLGKALELFDQSPLGLSPDSALELTELCLASGKPEEANNIARILIRNNHDNQALIERTRQLYADAGMAGQGETLIEETTGEVLTLNNTGARLLKEGKLDESIELFMKAARGMPENIVVNINAAYSIMMQMEKTGKVKKYASRVEKYLDRVHQIDPGNKKYHELTGKLQDIIAKHKEKAA